MVDREQGGIVNITKNGIRMHSLFGLSQLLSILKEAGKIDEIKCKAVAEYISKSQVKVQGQYFSY